jgi:hypothetical protein
MILCVLASRSLFRISAAPSNLALQPTGAPAAERQHVRALDASSSRTAGCNRAERFLLWLTEAMVALILMSASGCCSVVGYTAGVIAGNMDRRAMSADQAATLPDRQYVWLRLRDGEALSGRLNTSSAPDSLCVEYRVRPAASWDAIAPMHSRTIAREAVEHVEIAETAYRWFGFGVGAAADLTIAYLIATMDHSFRPDEGKASVGTTP